MPNPDKRVANILRLGSEPGAVVDERPAERVWPLRVRWALIGALLGAAIALLWAWYEWRQSQPPSITDGMR